MRLPFGQNTSMLVLGVNKYDLDFRVKINSVEQTIQRNSVGSGHVSHRWILAVRDHFNHRFVILQDMKHMAARR